MACKIKWSLEAADQLEETCNYIARDSKVYASIFAKRVISIVESVSLFPKSGRVVPEYNNKTIREKIFGSYRIIYRLKGELVEIIAIYHGARFIEEV